MAVKTQEELIQQFNTIVGEDDTRDEVLGFLTDMRDTLAENGAETIASLKQQVADTESTWRKKYRDAFMGKREEIPDDEEDKKPKSFDDLFETK